MAEIDKLTKIIWDYHHLNQKLKKADEILVFGNWDNYLAERAAELYKQGYAPCVIFTGDRGKITSNFIDRPEAEILAEEGKKLGIPKDKIIIENKSTNTKENIENTRLVLKQKGLEFNSFLGVCVPYMERRAYNTFKVVWPEKELTITSPQISFSDDINKNTFSKDFIINMIVGDLQRIKIYGERGWQEPQEIPVDIWEAYEKLVALGYNKHLVKVD